MTGWTFSAGGHSFLKIPGGILPNEGVVGGADIRDRRRSLPIKVAVCRERSTADVPHPPMTLSQDLSERDRAGRTCERVDNLT